MPVTYGYISDVHEKKAGTDRLHDGVGKRNWKARRSGRQLLRQHDEVIRRRLRHVLRPAAADGITPNNTDFVISAEENDQFAGANVGRAMQPTPAGCDGVTVACSYRAADRRTSGQHQGLLSTTASADRVRHRAAGRFDYVHGSPAQRPEGPSTERDTAAMTANNPYSGVTGRKDRELPGQCDRATELAYADRRPTPAPTYTLFPVPDYYFSTTGPNVSINSAFAWNHGYYSPNIDITWAAIVGQGVARRGVDGPQPAQATKPMTRTPPRPCRKPARPEPGSTRPICDLPC